MQSKRITVWGEASTVINTEYGDITFDEWCHKEKKRIGRCKVYDKMVKVDGILTRYVCLSRGKPDSEDTSTEG